MIFFAQMLCPNGHMIAAGLCEGTAEDSGAEIARSFCRWLHDNNPIVDCDQGCVYTVNLQTMCISLDIRVEIMEEQTIDEAWAAIEREARESARQAKLKRFLHGSRN